MNSIPGLSTLANYFGQAIESVDNFRYTGWHYLKHRDLPRGLAYSTILGVAFTTVTCGNPLPGAVYGVTNYTIYSFLDETTDQIPQNQEDVRQYFYITRGFSALVTTALMKTAFKVSFASKFVIYGILPWEFAALGAITSIGSFFRKMNENNADMYKWGTCDREDGNEDGKCNWSTISN